MGVRSPFEEEWCRHVVEPICLAMLECLPCQMEPESLGTSCSSWNRVDAVMCEILLIVRSTGIEPSTFSSSMLTNISVGVAEVTMLVL